MASFGEDKKVIKCNCEREKIHINNQFGRITKLFTVAEDIAFIRFRIIGKGVGEFRFDDIKFRKLKIQAGA